MASHEIKTPTHNILGYSELLQQHPDEVEPLAQAINRNAVRLSRLANDILDVTRIESKSLRLNKVRFNLNGLMSSIIADFRNVIEKENPPVNLSYEYKEKFIVQADKGRIIQIIYNLLDNAIKFTEPGGYINVKISAGHSGDQVIVSVKDDGKGVDPEIMPRLFTKFTTNSFTGIGLGLFISKNIIETHGGRIWAENNDVEGKGAIFYFSLPLIAIDCMSG